MKRLKNQILIILTLTALIVSADARAQRTMSGHVYNEKHEPLVATLITVKDCNIATLTNSSGYYVINIPKEYEENYVTFIYDGYLPIVVPSTNGTYDAVFEEIINEKIEEIYISTQKRLQSLIAVPISVTAIDGNRLNNLYTSQMDEISRYATGFQCMIQGQNSSGYCIRGVTSDGAESFFQPRISVYLNNVSNTRSVTNVLQPFDMERIEIVKGPQGTLFGRGAEIGAVHYITKKPTKEKSGKISLNYGNYNQRGASGYINNPINNNFANRFAFAYDAHEGYVENLAGGTLNGRNTIALRNSTAYDNEKTQFHVIIDMQHDDTPGICFKSPIIGLPDNPSDTSPFTKAYLNGGEDLGVKRTLSGLTTQLDYNFNTNWELSNTMAIRGFEATEDFDTDGCYVPLLKCHEHDKGFQFSEEFRINWQKSNKLNGFFGASYFYENCEHTMDFTADLRYLIPQIAGKSIQASMSELPTQVSTGIGASIIQMGEGLKQQAPEEYAETIDMLITQLSATVTNEIYTLLNNQVENIWFSSDKWDNTPDFLGETTEIVTTVLENALAETMEKVPMLTSMLGGASASDIVKSLDIRSQLESELGAFSDVGLSTDQNENQTDYCINKSADIFGEVNWNIIDKLYLTLGIRGTYEKQKTGYMSTSVPTPLLNGTVIYRSSNGEKVWTSADYYSWVGRVVLNYMITPQNNIYLSASKGHRPGSTYYNFRPDSVIKLRPEKTFSYELGAKGIILKNRFTYATAVYFYTWKHFQSSVAKEQENGTRVYQNSDEGLANCFGGEISTRYAFKKNVTIYVDYTYTDGKFANKDVNGTPQQLAGNRFRLTSKDVLDFGIDMNFPLRGNTSIYAHASYYYQSKAYNENENDENLVLGAYNLVNANAGIKFGRDRIKFDFGIWGKNIFDKDYIIDAGNSGAVIGFPTLVAGPPATFGLKFSASF